MRTTSFIKQLRIAALVAAFCAPAIAAPTVAPPQNPVVQTATASSQAGQSSTTQKPQAGSPASVAPGENLEILQAGMLPDPASLLPVAAIVGFSFLFGGIVSAFKTKP